MDLQPCPRGKFLALATDANRNIILDVKTGKQIRNLYGHCNDSYATPKVAWSCNGRYLLGNTQTENVVCVWDIASATLVKRIQGHAAPIRDLYSSSLTDCMVTTAYDKKTKIWMPAAPMS